MAGFQDSDIRWLRQLGFGQIVAALKEGQIIAVDATLVPILREGWPRKADHFQPVDALLASPPTEGQILIWLQQRTRQTVRRLRALAPGAQIVDAVHDLLPRLIVPGADRAANGMPVADWTVPVLPSATPAPASASAPAHDQSLDAPVYILAGPGSEVELLTGTLSHAAILSPVEVFPTALQRLIAGGMELSLLRFLSGVLAAHAAHATDGLTGLIIRCDALVSLVDGTPLGHPRFARRMNRAGVCLVHWEMRDKCRQLVLAQHYQDRPQPSVYSMSEDERLALKQRGYAYFRLLEFVPGVLGADYAITRRLGNQDRLLAISYEDFRRQPASVIETVSTHIERRPTALVPEPDVDLTVRHCPDLEARALRLTRDLVDGLGLHTSPSGSLLPYGHSMITRGVKA